MELTINNIIDQINQYNNQKNKEIKNLQIQYDKLNSKYQNLIVVKQKIQEV